MPIQRHQLAGHEQIEKCISRGLEFLPCVGTYSACSPYQTWLGRSCTGRMGNRADQIAGAGPAGPHGLAQFASDTPVVPRIAQDSGLAQWAL